MYVDAVPKARLYGGRHLIVGGTGRTEEADNGALTGDLSAIIIGNLPWWCEWRRTPKKQITLQSNWEKKIDEMAKTTINEDVYILAGVPSWTLVLLNKIAERQHRLLRKYEHSIKTNETEEERQQMSH